MQFSIYKIRISPFVSAPYEPLLHTMLSCGHNSCNFTSVKTINTDHDKSINSFDFSISQSLWSFSLMSACFQTTDVNQSVYKGQYLVNILPTRITPTGPFYITMLHLQIREQLHIQNKIRIDTDNNRRATNPCAVMAVLLVAEISPFIM